MAPEPVKCFLCGDAALADYAMAPSTMHCERCGRYQFAAKPCDHPLELDARTRVAGWIHEQNASGAAPDLTVDLLHRVAALPMPNYRRRMELALDALATEFPGIGNTIDNYEAYWKKPTLLGKTYCQSQDQLRELVRLLASEKLLEIFGSGSFELTPAGWLAFDDKKSMAADSAVGFVAMSFDRALDDAWTNGFDPAIRTAGFRPFRSDREDFVGGISDKLTAEIRRSRFVVADYTNQSHGVYFEMGFALGLNRIVIPTCRADQADQLHFDIRHLNTLRWSTPAELVKRLAPRIQAVVGEGPDFVEAKA